MESADVVVIGGGVIGASVAYHLAEAGCTDVIIVEREPVQGMGSTGKATGGVRAQFATPINIRMSLYSIEFLAQFDEATGYPSGYQPRGYLFLATTQQQLAELIKNRERQIACGLKNVELLGPEDVAVMVPELRVDDVVGATYCQTDGFIDALAVMRGFTARACERGARIRLATGVTGIDVDHDRVARVRTTRGTINSRTVVCAVGAWAADVAQLAGVEIPVMPLRRQIASVRTGSPIADRSPMVIDTSSGFHFRPDGTAPRTNILLAWPDPDETFGFKTDYDPNFTDKVVGKARHRVPSWSILQVDKERCRAGLYEMTPDHHAIIGGAPGVAGLFLTAGFSGHGVMHSPAAGRMTAEMILNGRSQFMDATPLRAERFAENRLLCKTSLL